jgi:hypothetical protein
MAPNGPSLETMPNPAERGRGKSFSEQLHPFKFVEVGPCRVKIMLPLDASLAEVEHVLIFHGYLFTWVNYIIARIFTCSPQ